MQGQILPGQKNTFSLLMLTVGVPKLNCWEGHSDQLLPCVLANCAELEKELDTQDTDGP